MTQKVPRTPPATFATHSDDIIAFDGELVRLRFTHPTMYPWDSLRPAGPLKGMRWDHHPIDRADPPTDPSAVLYAGTQLSTALAEFYQATRVVSLSTRSPNLTIWKPSRPLRLLDLTGAWPINQGASHALNAAQRRVCRAWARGIRAAYPDIDGLLVTSTMTGLPNIVLWETAADSFPPYPTLSRPLDAIASTIGRAAAVIGYKVVA